MIKKERKKALETSAAHLDRSETVVLCNVCSGQTTGQLLKVCGDAAGFHTFRVNYSINKIKKLNQ